MNRYVDLLVSMMLILTFVGIMVFLYSLSGPPIETVIITREGDVEL